MTQLNPIKMHKAKTNRYARRKFPPQKNQKEYFIQVLTCKSYNAKK